MLFLLRHRRRRFFGFFLILLRAFRADKQQQPFCEYSILAETTLVVSLVVTPLQQLVSLSESFNFLQLGASL